MCNAGNHIPCARNIKRGGGKIIQKKQRFRALHNKVIDAHGNQINADCVVFVDFDGDFQLRAHAVIGGDQNRIFKIAGGQVKQTAKTAQIALGTGAACGFCQRRDGANQRIARVNVDTGLGIGKGVFFVGHASLCRGNQPAPLI